MSTPEPGIPGAVPLEPQRSSVEIKTNAKGEPQISVKVYAETTELVAADAAKVKALELYKSLMAEVAGA